METKRVCNDCGAELPPEAPEGLCPKCLMKAAIGTQPAGASKAPGLGEDELPDPAKLAEYFPQLEILELLGHGGMGAVYKARQPGLDRLVALKILPDKPAKDPGFAERFTREARALAKLSHPNIVAVYDFGQTHGLHYFIMEYVDGPNLRQIEQTGKLGPREALQIIPQICEALQFAHDEGIVHRDIKPENVLLDKKGKVKIADFGLAKILGMESRAFRLTGAKDVMGTPHYMAPEQVENPRQVDHRADIYSLGVVFYEMLTGELPLGRFAPPSQKVHVDVRLDEIVLHALEKEPQRRYQHVSEVKTDVETIGTRAPAAPPPPPPAAVPVVPAPKREFWKTAVGVLAITLTIVLIGSLLMLALTAILPALSRAKARREAAAQLLMVVTGTVVDSSTGKPVAAARVADNHYGTGPDQAAQETWTDGNGRYRLRTWPEEHTIVASARGYEPRLATVLTKALGRTETAQVNFRLEPTTSMRKLNESLAEIDQLLTQYKSDHPLVKAKLTQVEQLRAELAREPSASSGQSVPTDIPPVVIKTLPESGASDVDPNLTELRATFSAPMKDQCWSWTTWGKENFPEITGPTHYLADGRTCVLPVKLKPGKVYAIWLNSEHFQDFQDAHGRPAVPYLLIFKTR